MKTDIMEVLRGLLSEDETIYEIARCVSAPIYIIGPVVDDIERKLDVSGCIEDTLHRLLDNKYGEDIISEALSAYLSSTCSEEFDAATYHIDLGYIIYDFYPLHVIDTGNHYKRPSHEYVVHFWDKIICKHLEIPDDPTDEEILGAISNLLGINPDEFICEDVRNDGSMLSVQNVLDDNVMFILMRRKNVFVSNNPFEMEHEIA